jgi:hypothetical protein
MRPLKSQFPAHATATLETVLKQTKETRVFRRAQAVREVVAGHHINAVVDNDRRPRLELLLHLQDLRFKRHFLYTVVGALTGHKGFDDPAQGVRAEHPVGNNHGSRLFLRTRPLASVLFASASGENGATPRAPEWQRYLVPHEGPAQSQAAWSPGHK